VRHFNYPLSYSIVNISEFLSRAVGGYFERQHLINVLWIMYKDTLPGHEIH